jgi:ABC-type phosphate/phosphonate transport system permease subunit
MVRQLTAGLEHFFGEHFFGDPLSYSADTTLMLTMLMLTILMSSSGSVMTVVLTFIKASECPPGVQKVDRRVQIAPFL